LLRSEVVWFAAVFAVSFVALGISLHRGWAWHLAVDVPNDRSLHSLPVPRVGGLLMMPWVLLGALGLTGSAILVGLAGVLVMISFADDRFGLPVGLRFLAHLLLSGLAAKEIGVVGVPGMFLATLAIAWMTNLFNFMDGSDGLAGGMAVFGFGAYAIAAFQADNLPTAQFSMCVASGTLAFLAFNFSPARIFLGDAGSISLGFLAAVLGLEGWYGGTWDAWFPLLVFSPFVVDASVTLIRRALRRERVWRAHREHGYQKLVQCGWSHRKLALAEYALMLGCGSSALALQQAEQWIQAFSLTAWAAGYTVLIVWIDRRSKRVAMCRQG
jgi:UDP-GlcNAc:undecaprenyl-phosphate GlcNAc-1-phosphate transferase